MTGALGTGEQQAILVSLLEALKERGSWCGETHVQKCTYFLQEALRVPAGFEFILYKHGPFAFDLRETLGEMRGNLTLSVKPQPAPYGPSLEPGPSAAPLKARYPRTSERYRKQIDFVANSFAKLAVGELERLSTALYVTRSHPGLSKNDRARRLQELKPHIANDAAVDAIEEIDKLLSDAPAAPTAPRAPVR